MNDFCTWPISYEACGSVPPAPDPEPVTLTWPDGSTLLLERSADVVTATAVPASVVTGGFVSVPVEFHPGGAATVQASPESSAYRVSIGSIAFFQRFFEGNEPAAVRYLADPIAAPALTGCSALDDLAPEQVSAFERMAAEMLWNWTDRIFGVCEVSARPCRSGCSSATRWMNTFWGRGPYPWGDISAGSWVPLLIGGEWFNMGCGCAGTCSCAEEGPAALRLPGPIVEVSSVKIDGVVVPPAEYQVLHNRLLVRLDGSPWPACQDLLAPSTAEGTFEIVYTRGVEVPKGGQIAAGILACELAKAACGDADCQLPQRIQTVTRQGLTVGIVDAFQGLNDARTGIWLIDSWTSSVRGPTAKPKAGVRSPDYRPGHGGVRSW